MKTFAACALACLTATLLWSCVSDDHRLTDTTKQNTMFIDDILEPIGNPTINGSRLSFQVVSTGCTQPEDFQATASSQDGQCVISVVRTAPDNCFATPRQIPVSLDLNLPDDCSGLPTHFANPALNSP